MNLYPSLTADPDPRHRDHVHRFGSMSALVTRVLEPTIGNYFRNAAQSSDVIDFLKSRSQRQVEARDAIGHALADYNLGAVDTLIGDIVPPDALMDTLVGAQMEPVARSSTSCSPICSWRSAGSNPAAGLR